MYSNILNYANHSCDSASCNSYRVGTDVTVHRHQKLHIGISIRHMHKLH